ncbi:MAG: hypothetical protein ACKPEY_00715 [Planctomycetota bacterium]
MSKVRCSKCEEELLGAVNRCWRCGSVFSSQLPADGQPPVRRWPIPRLQSDPITAELVGESSANSEASVSHIRRGSPFRSGARTQAYRELTGWARLVFGRAPWQAAIAPWRWICLVTAVGLALIAVMADITAPTQLILTIIALLLAALVVPSRLGRLAICLLVILGAALIWHGKNTVDYVNERIQEARDKDID